DEQSGISQTVIVGPWGAKSA
nr:Chain B, Agglutinin beta-3 chain [Artocarpus integer]1WS4_D Chain D, Agglutinin beta-3 chain [Artocarpus integer]1WS4_F Chain F, Agglutinin beta-3 chain [Artocarpus integer]1WS4_H Chain H, Agglutinin beta-3 chain [Artocarpus integer]1WS5_B Chain B, Agglutinin beta-3 chain [Artocarpus integer]1WS5_D Chain D, Agglutinin beta-3 chain [Artocarpus integer]1WS5_F Chain F, Agglutinin beta-3 chain [Artocarpus integer]1WS5_H Chain H, Agglutinin beta-3 chain [Artocarpus integer]